MIRRTVLTLMASSLLRVCGGHHEPEVTGMAMVPPTAFPVMAPQHGGAVAAGPGLYTEVAALPDGRVAAYVSNPQQQPVMPNDVQLALRKPDGSLEPVPVAYDSTQQAYIGRPSGIDPGSYPVQVSVQPTATAPPVQMMTPPLTMAKTTPLPAPKHGGQVQIIGDHVVESVSTPTGDLGLYWTDLAGAPVPAAQVQVPQMIVTVDGVPQVVVPTPQGDRLVGHITAPPTAVIGIAIPAVTILGVPYHHFMAPRPRMIAALPPPMFIGANVPGVYMGPPGGGVPFIRPHGYISPGVGVGVGVGRHGGIYVGAPGPRVYVGGGRHRGWGWH